MTTSPDPIAAETHALYLHLLNLKQPGGEAATDGTQFRRDIASAPEGKYAHMDAATLESFYAGSEAIAPDSMAAIRTVLDRAHHHAADPRFWRPRWLKTRQSVQYTHPSISDHKLHHHPID